MASIRQLWMIWTGFLCFMFFIAWYGLHNRKPYDGNLSVLHWAFVGLAIGSILASEALSRKTLSKASRSAAQGDLAAATKSFSAAKILVWAFANAIALWGFVATMIGAPEWFGAAFSLAAVLLMARHRPTTPDFVPSTH